MFAICSETLAQLLSDECVHVWYVPFNSKKVAIDGFYKYNRDLVQMLAASLWFVWFCSYAVFLQPCNITFMLWSRVHHAQAGVSLKNRHQANSQAMVPILPASHSHPQDFTPYKKGSVQRDLNVDENLNDTSDVATWNRLATHLGRGNTLHMPQISPLWLAMQGC